MRSWFGNLSRWVLGDRQERERVALERALKEQRPQWGGPESMHEEIMHAVRLSAGGARVLGRRSKLQWRLGPALGVLAVAGLVWMIHVGRERSAARIQATLGVAAAAMDAGGETIRGGPSAVMAPLTEELERVNRDVENAAQFLIASLP